MPSHFQIKRQAKAHGLAGPLRQITVGHRFFFVGKWIGGADGTTLYNGHREHKTTHGHTGYGTLYNPADGSEHTGEWRNNILGNPNGRGVKILNNTHLYEGELKDAEPNGQGKIHFGNDFLHISAIESEHIQQYEGTFKNGLPHGQGKLIWGFGIECEGPFIEGKKHGLFTLRLPEGVTVEVNFDNDQFQNYRVTAPENHPLRSDAFKKATPHKNRYFEQLYLGDINGYAIQLSPDGSIPAYFYMGEHVNGNAEGKGIRGYLGAKHRTMLEKGTFENFALVGEGIRQEICERQRIEKLYPDTSLIMVTHQGNFQDGKPHGQVSYTEKTLREYKHAERTLSKIFDKTHQAHDEAYTAIYEDGELKTKTTTATTSETIPLGENDDRGMRDIHGDPKDRARRIVGQTQRPFHEFVVADGSLYVRKPLRAIFGKNATYKRYDLESAKITEFPEAGKLKIETSVTTTCDGLNSGLVKELAGALRRERAKVYPDSSGAIQDRIDFPHMNWDSPY